MGAAESALFESGQLPPLATPPGGDGKQLLRRLGGVQSRRARARTRASAAPSLAPLTGRTACSVLSGAAVRVAERADGGGPTARVPGVPAATAATAAAAASARRSCQSGLARAVGPGCNGRAVATTPARRQRLRAAPRQLPPGLAWPGSHPRPRRRRPQPRRRVSAALVITFSCCAVSHTFFGRYASNKSGNGLPQRSIRVGMVSRHHVRDV